MEKQQLMIPSPNTTPYTTAPSSPYRFPNFYYSAPTSPIHSLIAFQQTDVDNDFAFGPLEPPSISAADELFHCGQIKPLKPIQKDLIPTSIDQTQNTENIQHSSSPFRISDILSDDENIIQKNTSLTWYNKWNLKKLLLFRSASEGRNKEEMMIINKYSRIRKCDRNNNNNDVKNLRFGSTDGPNKKVMRKVSAHEIHYTANRAVYEEMRKKTYLPYKAGLFGCLGFHNNGDISRGIHSVMKQP